MFDISRNHSEIHRNLSEFEQLPLDLLLVTYCIYFKSKLFIMEKKVAGWKILKMYYPKYFMNILRTFFGSFRLRYYDANGVVR